MQSQVFERAGRTRAITPASPPSHSRSALAANGSIFVLLRCEKQQYPSGRERKNNGISKQQQRITASNGTASTVATTRRNRCTRASRLCPRKKECVKDFGCEA